ncbi:MAG: hypothetical protein ACI8RP_001167 [Urechidicola sp.]|jgi:hypothetical protein|tara:strand:+ start:866 stop:1051 length:186 start_codon:yes stop_codon:yes gene_type:complete
MKLLFITFGLLALGVAGIAIKIWAKKDGEFSGTCASQSPVLNKDGDVCGFCGKMPENCENN